MTKVIVSLIFFLITSTTVNSSGYQAKVDWSYLGEYGPSNCEEFSLCKEGKEQSPINLPASTVNQKEANFSIDIQYEPSITQVRNTGETIQIDISGNDNMMFLKGTRYILTQIHFHAPSEHKIDGKIYPMEIHLVHKSEEGKLAVIGLFVEKGERNLVLAPVVKSLPVRLKEEIRISEKVDFSKLLPKSSSQYFYKGSLTTPPYTENVRWVIFKQPIEMSVNQISAITDIYKGNSRPIQPLNNREILVIPNH